jgi:hypothetical protein
MRREYLAANLLVYYNTGRGWKLQPVKIIAGSELILDSEQTCTIFHNGTITCTRSVQRPNMWQFRLAAFIGTPSQAGISP